MEESKQEANAKAVGGDISLDNGDVQGSKSYGDEVFCFFNRYSF